MSTTAPMSLREIAAKVGRSHTHVQRFVNGYQLNQCPRDRILAGCRLIFEHHHPADQVAAWIQKVDAIPTRGYIVSVDGKLISFADPDAVTTLLRRSDLPSITITFAASLDEQARTEAAPEIAA